MFDQSIRNREESEVLALDGALWLRKDVQILWDWCDGNIQEDVELL